MSLWTNCIITTAELDLVVSYSHSLQDLGWDFDTSELVAEGDLGSSASANKDSMDRRCCEANEAIGTI